MPTVKKSNGVGRVFLIGFSGSGKSTVGPLLAQKLGYSFIDTDESVARKERMSIPEIFAEKGERYFRRLEEAAIRAAVAKSRRAVISLGGGALLRSNVRRLVQQEGTVVYLSCSAREVHRRLQTATDRPLLLNKGPRSERIAALVTARRPIYVRVADVIVSTTRHTPKVVAATIISKLGRLADAH